MQINPQANTRAATLAVVTMAGVYRELIVKICDSLFNSVERRAALRSYTTADELRATACKFAAEHLAALYRAGVSDAVLRERAAIVAGRVARVELILAESEVSR